jgi:SpoVK/Ycf46/Vps4 family AAA+-type ATPase
MGHGGAGAGDGAGADRGLIETIRAAVDASPTDVRLRLQLAELLLQANERREALAELGRVLQLEPASARAAELVASAHARRPESDLDWEGLERELDEVWDVERPPVTLADVGGLEDVKERLEVAFLGPLRNPELRRLYRKDLRGGLLLYGPPGCGKGFIAQALAGELQAGFMQVSINDVLEMFIGSSERNLHDIFVTARRSAPTVLFFDELDALGRKRSQLQSSAMRTTVNQLLHELDGVGLQNENVFVLGATNHPWDVDPALRRPGRFDRTLLVLPPDLPAREAIFGTHLRGRPIASVDITRLARRTEGYTGADIAHVCDSAAEKAMIEAVRGGEARPIEMRDLEAALTEVRPSVDAWFAVAKNVVTFANTDGSYDDLQAYMKSRRLL